MIHDIIFSILGIGWVVSLIYLHMRLQGIAIHIDRRYPLKLKWRRYPSMKQIREAGNSNDDEQLKILVRKYRQNDAAIWRVLFGGILLMVLVEYLIPW